MIEIKSIKEDYFTMLGKHFRIVYKHEYAMSEKIVVGRLDNFSPNGFTAIWDEKKEIIRIFPTSSIRYMELAKDIETSNTVKKPDDKVRIIETNMIVNNFGTIKDHQSRIVEADSWEKYVNAFKNYNGEAVEFKSLTSMAGVVIPPERQIRNLEYDDFHLSCCLSSLGYDTRDKKLAYLIK